MSKKKSEKKTGILTFKDKLKIYAKYTIVGNNLYNYETQEAPALVYAMESGLRKIYPDDDDYLMSLNNHFQYFNTNVLMSYILVGSSLAIEERDGIKAIPTVQSLKTSLMGPFAGIGDSFFGVMLGTIVTSIAGSLAMSGNFFGPLVWLAYVIFLNFFLKYWLFNAGYYSGLAIIEKFGNKINMLTDAASIMGMAVIGSLIPSVVKITTGLKLVTGESKMSVQTDMLDRLMPGLLPVIATIVFYKLLSKKTWTPTKCILLVIVFSLVMAFFGILKVA